MNNYSAIKEMYYGRRGDGQLIKPDEGYHMHASKLSDIAERLKEKLKEDPESLKLLEELFWVSAGAESAAVDKHYREGFSFGVLLGLEIADMR